MSLAATLKNRHVVVALLVAPILAVVTWFGVGWLVGDASVEAVHPAPGASYPLVELSGCRYPGGICRLENNDVKLTLTVRDQTWLDVVSVIPLDTLLVGLRSEDSLTPSPAIAMGGGRTRWQLKFDHALRDDDVLRIAASAAGTHYYGEATLAFTGSDTD